MTAKWWTPPEEPKGAHGNQHLASLGDGDEYDLLPPLDSTYDTADKYQARIVENRMGYFCQMRFPLSEALTLAKRKDIDHHAVARYLRSGATHEEALEAYL